MARAGGRRWVARERKAGQCNQHIGVGLCGCRSCERDSHASHGKPSSARGETRGLQDPGPHPPAQGQTRAPSLAKSGYFWCLLPPSSHFLNRTGGPGERF